MTQRIIKSVWILLLASLTSHANAQPTDSSLATRLTQNAQADITVPGSNRSSKTVPLGVSNPAIENRHSQLEPEDFHSTSLPHESNPLLLVVRPPYKLGFSVPVCVPG